MSQRAVAMRANPCSSGTARFLHLALDVGDAVEVAKALVSEATHSAAQGSHNRAGELATRLEEMARVAPNEIQIAAYAASARGNTDYLAGRFRAAEIGLETADGLFWQVAGMTWERNSTICTMAVPISSAHSKRSCRIPAALLIRGLPNVPKIGVSL